jgi:hypothetical protein
MWLCKCENTTNNQVSTGFCDDTFHCQTTVSSNKAVDTDLSKLQQSIDQAIEKIAQEKAAGRDTVAGGGEAQTEASSESVVKDVFTQIGLRPALSNAVPVFAPLGVNIRQAPVKGGEPLLTSLARLISDPAKLVLNTIGIGSGQDQVKTTEVQKTPIVKPISTANPPMTPPVAVKSSSDAPDGALVPKSNIAIVAGSKNQTKDLYATVIEESRSFGGNNPASSFSSDGSGARRPGFFAWLCQERPWSNDVVSAVVPTTVLDGLCTNHGYQVGRVLPSIQTLEDILMQGGSAASMDGVTKTSTRVLVPSGTVQIWAEPASVPIGSRTTIFWKATGVENCIVTTADGSFYQTALLGGASTVPLTTATTYFISCVTQDGETIGESAIVRMAI